MSTEPNLKLHMSRLQFVQRTGPGAAARPPGFHVARIDDPDSQCSLIAVRGLIAHDALRALWDEGERLCETPSVHIDFIDASIEPGPWMSELETFVDALEEAGVGVRVVGVSPDHPDLC